MHWHSARERRRGKVKHGAAREGCGEVDHERGGFAALVQKRIELNKVKRRDTGVVVEQFHHQMRLTQGGATGDGRADGGRYARIEEINVERDVQQPLQSGEVDG